MSLNAADEGRRRGRERREFEKGYRESYNGENAGDTPGSGIRGSGGLGLGSGQKRSIDEYDGGGSGGMPDHAGRSTLEFREPRSQLGREPNYGQGRTRPVGRGVQESGNSRPDVDAGLAEREKRAAQDAAAESILRQRFPGGVTDTIAKARETQQAASAPKQVDPMASLKAPLQVVPGTFDPKATGENPFPATQAAAIPSAAAPAAASITAIPSAPAPVAAPAPAAKPYELTRSVASGGFYGETREGKGQKFTTLEEAQQFSRGQTQATAQVAATPAPASAVAADQAPEIAAESAPEREGSAEFESAPSAPAAKASLMDTLVDIGSRPALDVNNTNVVVQDNPGQSIRVPMQTGGTSAITGKKIVPMSNPSQAAIASGVKNLNAHQANVDAFNANQQLGRDSRAKSAAETQAILAKNAKAQSDWRAQKSGALPSPDAVAGATQVASPSPATLNSAFDAIPSTAPSVAIAGLTPPPVINAGPDPVQPMAPQSVANMDVPTLFKRPGGVRGQSRTSVIKPTPFYQL